MTTEAVDVTLNGLPLSDAVPEALVLQVLRPLVGNRRNVFVDVPGRAGSWTFPEEPGDRVLTIQLHLLADTFALRRAAVRALADWADVGDTAQLVFEDEPDRYHEAILDASADPNEWLQTATIAIPFHVGPYALALVETEEVLTGGAGSGTAGAFLTDWNAGISVDVAPRVTLTFSGGSVSVFTLNLNGDTVTVTATVPANVPITIDMETGDVYFEQSVSEDVRHAYDAEGDRVMQQVDGTFGVVIETTNRLAVDWTGAATSVSVTVTYRERYR